MFIKHQRDDHAVERVVYTFRKLEVGFGWFVEVKMGVLPTYIFESIRLYILMAHSLHRLIRMDLIDKALSWRGSLLIAEKSS
jgi:hypothetical protein